MMRAHDVVHIIDHLETAGVRTWLDGGWGVDALIGRQTREHDDLDVIVALEDVYAVRVAIAPFGFVVQEDELPTRLALCDADGRAVDMHAVTFDEAGGGSQQFQDGGVWRCPADGFAGEGWIDGRKMACLTAAAQIHAHLGYAPDWKDRHDMGLIAANFGIVLPAPYG
jgi:lincosamide nucleotidyltransferase A/C/D/E